METARKIGQFVKDFISDINVNGFIAELKERDLIDTTDSTDKLDLIRKALMTDEETEKLADELNTHEDDTLYFGLKNVLALQRTRIQTAIDGVCNE